MAAVMRPEQVESLARLEAEVAKHTSAGCARCRRLTAEVERLRALWVAAEKARMKERDRADRLERLAYGWK
jgi:hypothetical protein